MKKKRPIRFNSKLNKEDGHYQQIMSKKNQKYRGSSKVNKEVNKVNNTLKIN